MLCLDIIIIILHENLDEEVGRGISTNFSSKRQIGTYHRKLLRVLPSVPTTSSGKREGNLRRDLGITHFKVITGFYISVVLVCDVVVSKFFLVFFSSTTKSTKRIPKNYREVSSKALSRKRLIDPRKISLS